MKDNGIRQGSEEFAKPVVVKSDAVYVHTDIVPVDPPAGEEFPSPVYQYHEYIYTPDEYIQMLDTENTQLKETVSTMSEELTSAQLALVDVYEMIGGDEA